jgi:tetratricopeptide (TPR) repeat protein
MSSGKLSCPFCRELVVDEEEGKKRMMERVKANDPVALREMGTARLGEGDWDTAFEYWTKAAELGDHDAHYQLGMMCWRGDGVTKDEEKAVYHLELAAIGGDPEARYNLGCIEGNNGNIERAVKHFIVAANLGDEDSMKMLWKEYSAGNITKDDLEATLRTHKAAMDAMNSPEREAAMKFWKDRRSRMER